MTQVMETDPGVKQLTEKMGLESTELSGRVIRALYDDPNLLTLSGKTILTAEMAEHYGISDLDGYEPKSLRGIYGGPHPAFDIQSERSCLRQHRRRYQPSPAIGCRQSWRPPAGQRNSGACLSNVNTCPHTCRKQCATAYCAPVWTPGP
jgi:hypothetical protein